MDYTLLLVTAGLVAALAGMERLAAFGLEARNAIWRAHFAAIPVGAKVTAELWWHCDTWVTAFVDPSLAASNSLRVVAHRPLSLQEQAICLRWLRTEGFADADICRASQSGSSPGGESGAH